MLRRSSTRDRREESYLVAVVDHLCEVRIFLVDGDQHPFGALHATRGLLPDFFYGGLSGDRDLIAWPSNRFPQAGKILYMDGHWLYVGIYSTI